jgi:hypothetical protein
MEGSAVVLRFRGQEVQLPGPELGKVQLSICGDAVEEDLEAWRGS